MDTLSKELYQNMPWSNSNSKTFEKPDYERIARLKNISITKREARYSEFYEIQTFIDLVGNIATGKMLDLGAGTGNMSYIFSHLGWDVSACDYDATHFNFTNDIFYKTDLNKALPFEKGIYDVVISKQTIEHLVSPYHFISEIGRVLKPGGLVVLSTPNTTSLQSRWEFIKTGLPYGFIGTKWNYGGHMSPVFYSQLKAFMANAGIEQVSFHTSRYVLYNLNRINGRFKRFIGPFMKCWARKNIPEPCLYGEKLIVRGIKNS